MSRRALVLLPVLLVALAGCSLRVMPTETALFPGPGCGHSIVKPDVISLDCGRGRVELSGLQWSSWAKDKATATGFLRACRSACTGKGEGEIHDVVVTADKRKDCGVHGISYLRISWSADDAPPRSAVTLNGTRAFTCIPGIDDD